MLTESRAQQLLNEARYLADTGRAGDAATQLQSLIYGLARIPALRTQRESAFKVLLQILFQQGRDDRLSKVFKQYAAEYGATRDPDFDSLYLAGLVAECGCFQGLSSYILCSRLKRHDPAFDGAGYRIFDSFQGLSAPRAEDLPAPDSAEAARIQPSIVAGKFAAALAQVKRALAPFPSIEYFPGWIPEAFPATTEDRYRFVHVDVDLYQPTKDSLEYFWPRLVPGGVMLCDDYNWPGAKQAVDEFCAAHGLPVDVTDSLQACVTRPK